MTTKHPTIAMSPVKSSQIESIGHMGDTLAVKFRSGQTYHYHEFSAEKFADMQKAESIGKYFGQHVKIAAHPFTKVS